MERYIDANAFKRKLIDEKSFFPTIVSRALEEMPTADVEEVKHGEWEDMSDRYDKGKDLRCSLCHRRASSFVGGSEDWWDMWEPDYCPHCGAKMDGGKE